MSTYCELCGVRCKGKFKIITRKGGCAKILCYDCFDKTMWWSATLINKKIRPRKLTSKDLNI